MGGFPWSSLTEATLFSLIMAALYCLCLGIFKFSGIALHAGTQGYTICGVFISALVLLNTISEPLVKALMAPRLPETPAVRRPFSGLRQALGKLLSAVTPTPGSMTSFDAACLCISLRCVLLGSPVAALFPLAWAFKYAYWMRAKMAFYRWWWGTEYYFLVSTVRRLSKTRIALRVMWWIGMSIMFCFFTLLWTLKFLSKQYSLNPASQAFRPVMWCYLSFIAAYALTDFAMALGSSRKSAEVDSMKALDAVIQTWSNQMGVCLPSCRMSDLAWITVIRGSGYFACLITVAWWFSRMIRKHVFEDEDLDINISDDEANKITLESADLADSILGGGYLGLAVGLLNKNKFALGLGTCLLAAQRIPSINDVLWRIVTRGGVVLDDNKSDTKSWWSGNTAEDDDEDKVVPYLVVPHGASKRHLPRVFFRGIPRNPRRVCFNPLAWFMSLFSEQEVEERVCEDSKGSYSVWAFYSNQVTPHERKNFLTAVLVMLWFSMWTYSLVLRVCTAYKQARSEDRAASTEAKGKNKNKARNVPKYGKPSEKGKNVTRDLYDVYNNGDIIVAYPVDPQYDDEGRKIPAFWIDKDGHHWEDDGAAAAFGRLSAEDQDEIRAFVTSEYERARLSGGTWTEGSSVAFPKQDVESLLPRPCIDAVCGAESSYDTPRIDTASVQKCQRTILSPNGQTCIASRIKTEGADVVIFPAHLVSGLADHAFLTLREKGGTEVHVSMKEVVALSVVDAANYTTGKVTLDLAGFRADSKKDDFFMHWKALKGSVLKQDEHLPALGMLVGVLTGCGRVTAVGGGSIRHTATTVQGDCGALLVVQKKDGKMHFVGMHVAGTKSDGNWAVDLRAGLRHLVTMLDTGVREIPVVSTIDNTPAKMEAIAEETEKKEKLVQELSKSARRRLNKLTKVADAVLATPTAEPKKVAVTGGTLNPTVPPFTPSGMEETKNIPPRDDKKKPFFRGASQGATVPPPGEASNGGGGQTN